MIPLGVLAGSRHVAAVGGGPLSLSFQTYASSAEDAATYTFSGQSIGAADTFRTIVVAIGTRKAAPSPSVSSVTIGGVPATIVALAQINGTSSAIAYASVPTGTTADVAVTFSATVLRAGIGIWTLTGGPVAVSEASTVINGPVTGVAGGAVITCFATSAGLSAVNWPAVTMRYVDSLAVETFTHGGGDSTDVGELVVGGSTGGIITQSTAVFAPA